MRPPLPSISLYEALPMLLPLIVLTVSSHPVLHARCGNCAPQGALLSNNSTTCYALPLNMSGGGCMCASRVACAELSGTTELVRVCVCVCVVVWCPGGMGLSLVCPSQLRQPSCRHTALLCWGVSGALHGVAKCASLLLAPFHRQRVSVVRRPHGLRPPTLPYWRGLPLAAESLV